MIISGKVLTDEGFKNIEEIERTQVIINSDIHKHIVIKTESSKVREIVTFAKNTNLIISADTSFKTMYGTFTYDTLPEDKIAYFQLPNKKVVKDKLTKVILDEPTDGYNLYIDGNVNYVYCENYKIEAY